ncbi:hypothetical protein [Glycomyces tarimensis]
MDADTSTATRAARLLADLLRAAVLIGTVIIGFSGNIEGAVRFGLVFVILLAARRAGIPTPFDAALCVLLPLAALASVAQWYREFAWADWVMHCIATAAVVAALHLLAARTPLIPPLEEQRRAATVVWTLMLGLTVGVAWEFYEWAVLRVFDIPISVGYDDTIADLAMDALGSVLAGAALVAWTARTAIEQASEAAPTRAP